MTDAERDLPADGPPEDEKRDERREGELRQHVPELERETLGPHGVVEHAPEEQPAGALQCLEKRRAPADACRCLAVERQRHGGTGDEHEPRLDEVPESQSVPGMMVKLQCQGVERRALEFEQAGVEPGALEHQEHHDEAPHDVDRQEPCRGGGGRFPWTPPRRLCPA